MSNNKNITFSAVPQSEEGATIKPPPQKSWLKRFQESEHFAIILLILGGIVILSIIGLIIYFIVASMGTISFDKSLTTQYISPGVESYTIKCTATSSNDRLKLKIGWKVDGRDVENDSDDLRITDDDSLTILKPNQERDEKRKYDCVARGREEDGGGNVKEEDTMQIHIRIKRPPAFINTEKRPTQLTLVHGETAKISCQVDAQPPATWRWKCGGVDINNDHPNKDKFTVTNDENKSTLKLEYFPELFIKGGCFCFPKNDVSTHIISQGTNLTMFYPPVKLNRAIILNDKTVRLSTYRDESKGPADTHQCFFVQYKLVPTGDSNDFDDSWKFAERILTKMDQDIKACSIDRGTLKETYVDGFKYSQVFEHLQVVGSAYFDLHGLEPGTKYDVRAMVVTVDENNVPSIKPSDETNFRTKALPKLGTPDTRR